jgi:hypothetical protein
VPGPTEASAQTPFCGKPRVISGPSASQDAGGTISCPLRGPVETFARKNPALMILEDAHWADPTSPEVFSGAVDRIATRRALLIVTFLPEFEPQWTGLPQVTALTLNRLTRGARHLISQRACKELLSRTLSSSPRARENCSATYLNLSHRGESLGGGAPVRFNRGSSQPLTLQRIRNEVRGSPYFAYMPSTMI